jgi:TPR repeat protein
VRLGDLYREGSAVRPDPVRAVGLYRQAVEEGSTAGQQRLGEALLAGEGVERDRDAGLALLRLAAEDGDPWRQLALANGLLAESNADADRAEAGALLEDAAEAGNPYAQIRLADFLVQKGSADGEAGRALTLLEAAAEQNITLAFLRLGQAYLDGSVVAADPAKGLELLERAAAADDPEALIGLGEAYAGERAIPADGKAASDAFARAAELGSAYGYVRLGELKRDGQLVEPDMNQAIADFEAASAAGEAWIQLEIAGLHRDGRAGVVDIDRAVAAYETAIRLDVPGAEIAFARDLARGLLGRNRRQEGVRRLRQAVEDEVRGSVSALSDALMWGWGVRQDQRQARALLEEAAEGGDIEATRNLIALHRDGRYPTYRRSLSRADALLEDIADSLPKHEYEIETLLLEAARSARSDEFALLVADLEAMTRNDRRNAFTTLRWVNENAYVYVLQDALRYRGYLDASPTGRLDRRTIAAFQSACRDLNQGALCSHGPLTDVSVRIAASLLRGQ